MYMSNEWSVILTTLLIYLNKEGVIVSNTSQEQSGNHGDFFSPLSPEASRHSQPSSELEALTAVPSSATAESDLCLGIFFAARRHKPANDKPTA